MTDILQGMLTESEFLEHFGVKGMKWGLTREQAADGNPRAQRKLAKADHAWSNEMHSMKGFIKVHNAMADRMNNGELDKLNNSPKYKDKAPLNDPKLNKQYIADYEKLNRRIFDTVVKELYGESPSGKFTTSYNNQTGSLDIVPVELQHGFNPETNTFSFKVKIENGMFAGFEEEVEHAMEFPPTMMTQDEFLEHMAGYGDDWLEHYGVKGMRWGKNGGITRSENRSLNRAARAEMKTAPVVVKKGLVRPERTHFTDKAKYAEAKAKYNTKRDSEIDAARARQNSGANRQDLAAAKAKYKSEKYQVGTVRAKAALNSVRAKNLEDYYKANENKSGRETTNAAISAVAGVVLSALKPAG